MNLSSGAGESRNCDGVMSEEEEDDPERVRGNESTPGGIAAGLAQHGPPAGTPQTQSSALTEWTINTGGEILYTSGEDTAQVFMFCFSTVSKNT